MTITIRRMPYWFAPKEFKSLISFVAKKGFTETHDLMDGIRSEVGVARLRADNMQINTEALTTVLGLPENSIPVHFSDEEADFLKNLDSLPETLRKRLI